MCYNIKIKRRFKLIYYISLRPNKNVPIETLVQLFEHVAQYSLIFCTSHFTKRFCAFSSY